MMKIYGNLLIKPKHLRDTLPEDIVASSLSTVLAIKVPRRLVEERFELRVRLEVQHFSRMSHNRVHRLGFRKSLLALRYFVLRNTSLTQVDVA